MTDTPFRIAGAPISWGVCEVPGWGYQLGPDKVLAEMREVGLLATELGPDGFLPAEPDAMATVLAQHGLQAVGGFTPLLLHVPSHDPVPEVERILEGYVASNASTLVLSSVSGQDGYDSRPELDDKGWQTLLDNLSRISGIADSRGDPRGSAPARRHDDREHRRGAAGARRARPSRCAWTPGTCSSAVPTPPSSPGRRRTGSRTSTSRTSTRARPSMSRTGAGPTPRASPAACTDPSARETSTSPRSWST